MASHAAGPFVFNYQLARIAINTRLVLDRRMDGMAWFAYETAHRMAKAHPEHEFHLIFDRKPGKMFERGKNIFFHVLPPQARRPVLMKFWFDHSIPWVLRKIKADVFVSPDAQCSLRTEVPQLLVIHDLNFAHEPRALPKVYAKFLNNMTPRWVAKAERIATVSKYSKSDIAEMYKRPAKDIDVVYNGIHSLYRPIAESKSDAVRSKWTKGKPYFIVVGSVHPRKNLQRVIPAFVQFKKATGSDAKLVVVGEKFWSDKQLKKILDDARKNTDIVFTGHVGIADLAELVGGAFSSVYASTFEGFGIPIVEAFACHVPVITSNVTSMPEVAGDAALLVDPMHVSDIAEAMIRMWENESLRKQLVEKGKKKVEEYSWEKTAELLWQSIEKILRLS
jgi:glycosyltransferase involved in cell wall biosynthesis